MHNNWAKVSQYVVTWMLAWKDGLSQPDRSREREYYSVTVSFCVLCVNILLTNIWTSYCILISIQCPNWDISHGKSLCTPWGKSAAAESHYPAKRHPLTPVENVRPASALALCLQTSVESVPEWRIDCLQFKIAVVLHILTTASCSVFKHNCPNALLCILLVSDWLLVEHCCRDAHTQ